MCAKKGKLYPSYVSKHNSDLKKQVILLMIPNREEWHYLAVKILSALLIGITSKHHGDFYCLNCFYLLLNIMVIFIVSIAFMFLQQKTNFNHIKDCLKTKIFLIL